MSRTGRRYFRWLRNQFGLTTIGLRHNYFKSDIGGVSTVGISLPKTGVPTVCSERAVSGILYVESTLSTGYTQYVFYCDTMRGYLLLRRDPEGVVSTSGLLDYFWPWNICLNAID